MNNRNKIAALVLTAVTATSIFSGVSSVQAATKLETSEGVINEIQMYGQGTYVFDGYKNEDQDTGVYHFNGYGDVEIEDVDGVGEKYGMNYLNFKDDDVLFNLLTGKEEEETIEDQLVRIESKFRTSVVKKVDRYDNARNITIGKKIAENTFGPVWYETKLESDSDAKEQESFTVYLNDSGEYIDVSETLNITHYSRVTGEKIKFDTFEDLEENNYKIQFERTLFMDSQYMYRLLIIVNEENSDTGIYVQRISNEAGEKTKDGAKLPKSVKSYEQGELDVLGLLQESEENKEITVRVKGNSVYVIKPDRTNNEISIEKYDLKKSKEDLELEDGSVIKADMNTIEFDEDYDCVDKESMQDFSVDLYGNLWILNKGKVQRLDDEELVTVFTTDRTMDKINVFDENNLAVWNTEDEIYSIHNGNKAAAGTEEAEETEEKTEEAVVTGWVKNDDGTWSFINADKTKKTGWYNDNGTWYMLKEDGIMATGWYNDNGTWYYLQESGAMKTGWFKDTDGRWYFMNASGSMAHDTVIDGYKLGSNGAWIQ